MICVKPQEKSSPFGLKGKGKNSIFPGHLLAKFIENGE